MPLHGHAHAAHAGHGEEEDVMHFGGDDDGDDDDGDDAGDDDGDDDGARLAEQLQGLIGNIANQVGAQGGGPAPSSSCG